jgi:D-sedoheptulose 7-phosphate isomerase
MELDSYLTTMSRVLEQLPRQPLETISEVLWKTYGADGTIFTCGNGGSAATASHFTCDLRKWTVQPGRRRVRSIALTDNVPLLTAYSNDLSYADVFVEQLIGLYRPGDVLVAISGSGNSPNILRAVAWANEQGAATIGLTGFDGGALAGTARHALRVDNHCMPQVEDAHSTVCHALAYDLALRMDAARLDPLPLARLKERVVG